MRYDTGYIKLEHNLRLNFSILIKLKLIAQKRDKAICNKGKIHKTQCVKLCMV